MAEADYTKFLQPQQNGSIWWRLEDAVKLCAGFVPAANDRLRAPSNEERAAERQILGAFHHRDPLLPPPVRVTRGNDVFVEARAFINWLSGYRAVSGELVDFPFELARHVAYVVEGRRGEGGAFVCLSDQLRGKFDLAWEALDDSARARVERAFAPFGWEEIAAEQREQLASQWDAQHDPARDGENNYWWQFYCRQTELKRELGKTESPVRKEEIRQELQRMVEVARRASRARKPRRQQRATTEPRPRYIAYPKALGLLTDRLKASAEELAAWLFIGPELGGLQAFLYANELDDPPRFYFADSLQGSGDYIAPMVRCWFREDDLERFNTPPRFIPGSALLKKWGDRPGIPAREFIEAKIEESRLLDIHPIFGGTRASNPDKDYFPPLETGLFELALVEAIDQEDFPEDPVADTSHLGPTCGAEELKRAFVVFRGDPQRSDKWWSKMTRAAGPPSDSRPSK